MNRARDDILTIFHAGLDAVNPEKAVKDHAALNGKILKLCDTFGRQQEYDLGEYKNIYLIGAGKASALMARGVKDILGSRISGGVISVKYGYTAAVSGIEIIEAGHPLPDENSVKAAEKVLETVRGAGESDLIISLISGGGSSLLCLPPGPISLEDKRAVNDLLLRSGASIHEINSVRKHISCIKGGRLAAEAWPATVLNLMISDVIGDDPGTIASGPFSSDNSTFSCALEILEKYELILKAPGTVLDYLKKGAAGLIDENPGQDSKFFGKIQNLIIASGVTALEAAKKKAITLGYNAIIISSGISGDTGKAASLHNDIAREVVASANPVPPACILSGGETTVKVKGRGLGGRNTEFVLHSAKHIAGLKNITLASIGTDGTDGPTDAAGAFADGNTVNRASALCLDVAEYLKKNDSYSFFKELADLIITGPTNTNVMDIRIILIS